MAAGSARRVTGVDVDEHGPHPEVGRGLVERGVRRGGQHHARGRVVAAPFGRPARRAGSTRCHRRWPSRRTRRGRRAGHRRGRRGRSPSSATTGTRSGRARSSRRTWQVPRGRPHRRRRDPSHRRRPGCGPRERAGRAPGASARWRAPRRSASRFTSVIGGLVRHQVRHRATSTSSRYLRREHQGDRDEHGRHHGEPERDRELRRIRLARTGIRRRHVAADGEHGGIQERADREAPASPPAVQTPVYVPARSSPVAAVSAAATSGSMASGEHLARGVPDADDGHAERRRGQPHAHRGQRRRGPDEQQHRAPQVPRALAAGLTDPAATAASRAGPARRSTGTAPSRPLPHRAAPGRRSRPPASMAPVASAWRTKTSSSVRNGGDAATTRSWSARLPPAVAARDIRVSRGAAPDPDGAEQGSAPRRTGPPRGSPTPDRARHG
jgi:hypothetical protein